MRLMFRRQLTSWLLAMAVSTGGPLLAGGIPTDQFLNQVKDLMKAKSFGRAVTLIKQELGNKPTEYKLWLALGYCYEGDKKPGDALIAFRHAQKLNPGLNNLEARIKSLEKLLKPETPVKTDQYLTPDQKKAKEIFAQVLKDKSFGKFDEAFQNFLVCVDLNSDYLNGNDEGVILAALNYYQENLAKGDKETRFYHSAYLYFKGDYNNAEQGFYKFIEAKPTDEFKARAERYLKLITERRERQNLALVKTPTTTPDAFGVKIREPKGVQAALPKASSTAAIPLSSGTSPVLPGEEKTVGSGNVPVLVLEMEPLKAFEGDIIAQDLKSGDTDKMRHALWKIANYRSADPETIQQVTSVFETASDEDLKAHALDALTRIGTPAKSALPQVIPLMSSEDLMVRLRAMEAAVSISDKVEEVVPPLLENIKSENGATQRIAVQSVIKLGTKALPLLNEALTSASGAAKERIQKAISEIESR
ncbi:MAG: HEAT repeat domain-containing protein [Candidatus Ozemobacteraceae bacterium]